VGGKSEVVLLMIFHPSFVPREKSDFWKAKEICSQGLPDDAPPSLFHACQKLKRLQID
jgi:hypothetical protein